MKMDWATSHEIGGDHHMDPELREAFISAKAFRLQERDHAVIGVVTKELKDMAAG